VIREGADICCLCFADVVRTFVVRDIDGHEVIAVCVPCMVAMQSAFSIDHVNLRPRLRIVR